MGTGENLALSQGQFEALQGSCIPGVWDRLGRQKDRQGQDGKPHEALSHPGKPSWEVSCCVPILFRIDSANIMQAISEGGRRVLLRRP